MFINANNISFKNETKHLFSNISDTRKKMYCIINITVKKQNCNIYQLVYMIQKHNANVTLIKHFT